MNQPASQSVAINQKLVGTIACTMLVGGTALVPRREPEYVDRGLPESRVGHGGTLAGTPSLKRKGIWGHTSWGVIVLTVAVALVLTGKRVDMRIILPLLIGIVLATKVLRPGSLPKRK